MIVEQIASLDPAPISLDNLAALRGFPRSWNGRELHLAARIDNFNHIARAYGNGAASCVHDEICRSLRELVSSGYFGGGVVLPGEDGTFDVIIREVAGQDNGLLFAERFVHAWAILSSSAVEYAGVRIHAVLSASGPGIELCHTDPSREARLLADARNCLSSVPNQTALPQSGPEWAAAYRRDMASAARFFQSFDAGAIALAWQPVRGPEYSDAVLYHEGVLRGVSSEGQLESQADMIVVLERLGLASTLDRLVLEQAFEELCDEPDARIGINVSGQSVCLDPWWEQFACWLGSSRTTAARLFIEITETAPLPSPEQALRFVKRLKQTGSHIVLDDFGVGHASFRTLLGLVPDVVKIDGGFLRRALNSERDRAILTHVIGLANAISGVVIAEGVETADLRRLAVDCGAHWQQGYFLGAPALARRWRYAGQGTRKPDPATGRGDAGRLAGYL